MNRHKSWIWGASAVALLAASSAMAAESEADNAVGVEEVVVTAQKRAENIQDVPLSIMAVSEKAMEAKGVQNVRGLERMIPNLRIDTIAQQSGVALRIRGFGANSNAAIDPSVAPYIDGVFIPRPGAVLTTFLDVEKVEVLRGPQGTLFGRNATVGAISMRTHAPGDGFEAKVAAEARSYGTLQGEGMVNVPVNDKLALRFAGIASKTDGYIKNRLDGKTYGEGDTVAGRASAKWSVTDDLTWTFRADYARTNGDGVPLNQVDTSTASPQQLANFAGRIGTPGPVLTYPPSRTIAQFMTNLDLKDRQWGLTSDLSWDIGGYTVRLIDAYRDWKNDQSDGDVVFTPLDLLSRDASFDSESQSHELQLISPKGALLDGRLDFVAGLYYFDEDYAIGERFNLGSRYCSFAVAAAAPPLVGACNAAPKIGAATNQFEQNATSKAVYLQTNFAVTPSVDLILGARQTWDKKHGAFVQVLANPTAALLRAPENVALKFDDDQPSWRASLNWRATDDVMAFVTYSTGYKSGGLNSAGGTPALAARRLFNSETSKDWEAGVKSVLLDRRLLLNATLYRTTLDDFQERSFDGTSFIVRNAGSIRSQGFELEGQARPERHVNVDFGVAYLDSEFTANHTAPGLPACNGSATSCPTIQDLTGRTATFSPKWQWNLGAEYVSDPFFGGFTASLRGDASYTSPYYSTSDLSRQGVVDSYTLYGARITLTSPDKSWNVALFGENLSNEIVFRQKFPQILDSLFGVRVPSTGATLMRGFVGTPRTWGMRASKTF